MTKTQIRKTALIGEWGLIKERGNDMAYGKKKPAKKMAAKKTSASKKTAGNGLTPAQKKLPPAIQAAILRKKKKGGK